MKLKCWVSFQQKKKLEPWTIIKCRRDFFRLFYTIIYFFLRAKVGLLIKQTQVVVFFKFKDEQSRHGKWMLNK